MNSAPSLAMRSMFGVRNPIMPRLYALGFHQPMSSPMIIRILGLAPARCAAACGAAACTGGAYELQLAATNAAAVPKAMKANFDPAEVRFIASAPKFKVQTR